MRTLAPARRCPALAVLTVLAVAVAALGVFLLVQRTSDANQVAVDQSQPRPVLLLVPGLLGNRLGGPDRPINRAVSARCPQSP